MKRKAFTLIELLVVIAIIALLVSILLPSLATAKELAKKVVCQSNLKGISVGLGFYQNDYDGQLPPMCWGGVALNNWFTKLYPYTEYPIKGYYQNNNVYDTKSTSFFRCPEIDGFCRRGWYVREDGVSDLSGTAYMINYNVHDSVASSGVSWALAGKNVADIPKPGSTLYCLDSQGITGGDGSGWFIDTSSIHFDSWSELYTYYHMGRQANTLWVDGHIADISDGDFTVDKLWP